MDPNIENGSPISLKIGPKWCQEEQDGPKIGPKWCQEEQDGPKMEPRGAKNRSRSRKMAQDSAKRPPKRPKTGYGAKPVAQNGSPNRAKSVKQSIQKLMFFF